LPLPLFSLLELSLLSGLLLLPLLGVLVLLVELFFDAGLNVNILPPD
jgi:hypothetical protein